MRPIDPATDWIDVAPWRSQQLLLIHRAGNGVTRQAWSLGEKRDLLCETAGLLLAVWPGEFKSTARELLPAQRRAVLEVLA